MTTLIYTLEQLKKLIIPFIKQSSKGRRTISLKKISFELKQQLEFMTPNCRDNLSERIYWILNDISDYPTCIECGTRWQPRYYGLSTDWTNIRFCSNKCLTNNKEVQQKKQETCVYNYGVSYPLQSKIIKQQVAETMMQRFGVQHALQNSILKEKANQTMIERYGESNPFAFNSDRLNKIFIEKFGVINVSQNEEILQKKKNSFLLKFNVENPFQSEIIKK